MKKLLSIILIVVTFAGTCMLGGCNDETLVKSEMFDLKIRHFSSGAPTCAIIFKNLGGTQFECTADNGFLAEKGGLWNNKITVNDLDTVYWYRVDNTQQAFVSIVASIDKKISGYAVIEILRKGEISDYKTTVIESVVLSRNEQLTQEQVCKKIEEKIQNFKIEPKTDIQ